MPFFYMRVLVVLAATTVLAAAGHLAVYAQTESASSRLAVHVGRNAAGPGSVRAGQIPQMITLWTGAPRR